MMHKCIKIPVAIAMILLILVYTSGPSLYGDTKAQPTTKAEPTTKALFYSETTSDKALTLFFGGDLMVHGAQYKSAQQKDGKTFDFKPWFEHLIEPIANSDYALLNLETTLTEDPAAYSGFPLFRSPTQIVYDLKAVGFDGVVTANNHSLDAGLKGILTTIKHIKKAGLDFTGTTEVNLKSRPILVSKNGLKIAIVNASYGTNGMPIPKDHPKAINLLNLETMKRLISEAKDLGPDAIVAYVHWGVEYARQPNSYQTQWAKDLANLGADAIIGAHPHVVQPEAWIQAKDGRKVYVNYSLGNFISNQRWRYSDTGLALQLKFTKEADKPIQVEVLHIPFWVDKETGSGIQYTAIPLTTTRPKLKRLTEKDHKLMQEAYQDFLSLYKK